MHLLQMQESGTIISEVVDRINTKIPQVGEVEIKVFRVLEEETEEEVPAQVEEEVGIQEAEEEAEATVNVGTVKGLVILRKNVISKKHIYKEKRQIL